MTPNAPFRIGGGHVLAGMLVFFAAIVVINVAFAVVAIRSFPGEDVRRSYLQGLRYNDTLADRREQAAIGWRAQASLIDTPAGPAVRTVLRDAAGRPLDGVSLAGELRWPADARLDRSLVFRDQGGGAYLAHVPDLRTGRWEMRARAASAGGQALDFEAEFTWPSTR